MMEPSTVHVATSDFPLPHLDDRRLYKDGSFRWPYGLLNYRAWEFEPGLFLDDVAPRPGNPFGSAAAVGLVPLTSEEEARILAHPHHQIELIESVASNRKLYGQSGSKRRGAPAPTEGVRRGIMHMRNAPAFVYWFILVTDNKIVGHKIGWAFDWKQRLKQFNSVSLHPIGGLLYKAKRTQEFDTARQALHVEQELLKAFDSQRHPHNREVLRGPSTAQIEGVWNAHVQAAMLGRTVDVTGHPVTAVA
jgi:hypothetical protein